MPHKLLMIGTSLVLALGFTGAVLMGVHIAEPSRAQSEPDACTVSYLGSYSPNISADGSTIVFWRSPITDDVIDLDGFTVWHYDIAAQQFFSVTTRGSAFPSATPGVSADGSKIVFAADVDFLGQGVITDQREIWLYDTQAQTVTRITDGGAPDRVSVTPDISADGSRIVFLSNADFLNQGNLSADLFNVWLYDTQAQTYTRITPMPSRNRFPTISADGSQIAFSSTGDFLSQGGIESSQYELWLYDIETASLTRVTTSPHERQSYRARFSGDGGTLVFDSNADLLGETLAKFASDIWLADTHTLSLTRVTTGNLRTDFPTLAHYFPDINHDGTRLTFFSESGFFDPGNPPEQYHIWLYDVPSRVLTPITPVDIPFANSRAATISGKGHRLTFASNVDFHTQTLTDTFHLWLYNTASLSLTRITPNPEQRCPVITATETLYLPFIRRE